MSFLRLKALLCLEERETAKWRSGWLELATNHPVVLLHSWKVGKTGLQTNVLSFHKIVYPFHTCHFIGPAGSTLTFFLVGEPPTPTPLPPLRPHRPPPPPYSGEEFAFPLCGRAAVSRG